MAIEFIGVLWDEKTGTPGIDLRASRAWYCIRHDGNVFQVVDRWWSERIGDGHNVDVYPADDQGTSLTSEAVAIHKSYLTLDGVETMIDAIETAPRSL